MLTGWGGCESVGAQECGWLSTSRRWPATSSAWSVLAWWRWRRRLKGWPRQYLRWRPHERAARRPPLVTVSHQRCNAKGLRRSSAPGAVTSRQPRPSSPARYLPQALISDRPFYEGINFGKHSSPWRQRLRLNRFGFIYGQVVVGLTQVLLAKLRSI